MSTPPTPPADAPPADAPLAEVVNLAAWCEAHPERVEAAQRADLRFRARQRAQRLARKQAKQAKQAAQTSDDDGGPDGPKAG